MDVLNFLVGPAKKRYTSRDGFYQEVFDQIVSFGHDFPFILEHYIREDGEEIVFTDYGKIYSASVIDNNGTIVVGSVNELLSTTPRAYSRNSKVVLNRSKDGKLHFVAIASSSVVNRVGEIDSTKLYDHFIENYSKQEPAYLTFYHSGEVLKFGEITDLQRSKNLLILHGLVDESTIIGRKLETVLTEDYGISIGFKVLRAPNIEVINGARIPVYEKGVLVEASLLKERDAASYFTSTFSYREGKMDNELKSKLLELLGEGSEEDVDNILTSVETRQRTIEEAGMVTRTETPAPPVEVEEELEILIPEETIEELRQHVSGKYEARIAELEKKIDELGKRFFEMPETTRKAKETPVTETTEELDPVRDAHRVATLRMQRGGIN